MTKLEQTQDSNKTVQIQIQPEYQSIDRNTRKSTKCMAIHPLHLVLLRALPAFELQYKGARLHHKQYITPYI